MTQQREPVTESRSHQHLNRNGTRFITSPGTAAQCGWCSSKGATRGVPTVPMTVTRTGDVEPRTEAGRALMEFLAAIKPFLEDAPVLSDGSLKRIRPLVAAIEQEARRLALAEGLDETLLAMAIDRAWSSPDYEDEWLNTEGEPRSEVMAEQIAAEYARLSEEARKP